MIFLASMMQLSRMTSTPFLIQECDDDGAELRFATESPSLVTSNFSKFVHYCIMLAQLLGSHVRLKVLGCYMRLMKTKCEFL